MKSLLRLAALAFAALCLISSLATLPCRGAEHPLPKDLPPYAPIVPYHAPRAEVKKLSNGLTLWLIPLPGFPKVAFTLAVRGGMASDPRDLPGLAELLISTLDQGTKTRNARDIAEQIQAAGGDLTGDARPDAIIVSTAVLAPKAGAAVALLADISANATFPDGEVELAKRNAAEQLQGNEAEPGFLAQRALAKAVFGQHPYSVISPTQDSISKTTAADLRREYARRFRPDQALLVAVGDFESASLLGAVEKYFGGWKNPAEAPAPDSGAPRLSNPHGLFFVPRAGSVQTTLALASLGPTERDPDYAPAEVANAIYGGMFGSRLILNIREDKGYTYSPRVSLRARRNTGLFETRADVRNAVTGASLNEIEYELNRMATTSPNEGEMERARRYLVGVRAIFLQSEGAVSGDLADLWVYGLPPEELGLESEKIEKVTASQVDAVARKYFPFSRQTKVAVGEQKTAEEQLGVFGLDVKPLKPVP